MKRTRWLLLVAIVAIVVAVAVSYLAQKEILRRQAPARPQSLPDNISATASKWVWSERVGGNASVEIRASAFQQTKEPPRFELTGVELRIFDKDNAKFDLVKSAKATFNPGEGTLYSDGAVEITMNVPADGKPAGRIVSIQSSGVTFNSRTAAATTERPTKFKFDQGDGESIGASYDSTMRELLLKNEVRVTWNGKGPRSKPMVVEAGQMIYKELASHVILFPWSRLKRDGLTMDAGDAVVNLKDGAIDTVDAKQARGTDAMPGRNMEFAARDLHMEFTEKGLAKKVTGVADTRLASITKGARTDITSDRLDLQFQPGETESVLQMATATGKSVVQSKPLPLPNQQLAETRILRSDVVQLKMRAGGQEIESVETMSPGQVEFLPNRPGQRKRDLSGERIWIAYGQQNTIQTFRSVNVTTRTEGKKKDAPPSITTSRDFLAHFDPSTGEMSSIDQWGDFRYEEGEQRAKAEHATLEQATNLITLTGGARVWDPTGTVSGDKVLLDQKSGDFSAEGNVTSSRVPDSKGGSGMLARNEPVQARAAKMTSRDGNKLIHYERKALMWQGANRIQADQIDIDRKRDRLKANGSVVSQFVDKPKPGKKEPQTPVYTVIRAPALDYSDVDRVAHYSGGSTLIRPGLDVTAAEIRAFLKKDPDANKTASLKPTAPASSSGSSDLDKVFADGQVRIVQKSPVRTRTGTGEHSEYYVDEEKVVITGGSPLLVDSVRGETRGRILTWFAQEDRLLVDNTGSGASVSRIVKKK